MYSLHCVFFARAHVCNCLQAEKRVFVCKILYCKLLCLCAFVAVCGVGMDGIAFFDLSNSISVTSVQWMGDNDKLYAMKLRLC